MFSPKVTIKVEAQTQNFITRLVDRVCKSLDTATAALKSKKVDVKINIQ